MCICIYIEAESNLGFLNTYVLQRLVYFDFKLTFKIVTKFTVNFILILYEHFKQFLWN